MKRFLKPIAFASFCGLFFAVVISVLRIVVVTKFSPADRDESYYYGLIAGACTQFVIGSIASFPFWLLSKSRWIVLPALFLGAIIFLNIAAFHYEAVLLALPGVNALYYLTDEIGEFQSSFDRNAPVQWLILEWTTVFALLLFLFNRSARTVEGMTTERRLAQLNLIAAAVWIAGAVVCFGPGFRGSFYWGSREPLSYLQQSALRQSSYSMGDAKLLQEEIDMVRDRLTAVSRHNLLDKDYPLCETKEPSGSRSPNRRNAIMLILEGVGARELEISYEGVRLMPNLARIESENLSFRNFFANGTQSVQALPAIFSGQPPQTAADLLKRLPMVKLTGFPKSLRDEGYATAYLHGSNLSYENQDVYLKMVGFEEFLGYDPLSDIPVSGWAYSDAVTFSQLKSWLLKRRAEASNQPFFISTFTMTTHDPYDLPDDYKPLFDRKNMFSRFADAAHYLDIALGDFYEWYLREEKPKGTLLIITGDHAPRVPYPDAPKTTSTGELEHRFKAPLIIAGLTGEETQRYNPYALRYGSHMDLQATILHLLGLSSIECSMGMNMLADNNEWSDDRYILSIGGVDLRFIYIHNKNRRWAYDRDRETLRLYDMATDQFFQIDLLHPNEPLAPYIRKFLLAYQKFSFYLLKNDAYAPERMLDRIVRPSVPKTTDPIYVSNRGKAEGVEGVDNTLAAIENAVKAGFKWIKINIDITKDGIPVLVRDGKLHDSEIVLRDGRKEFVENLTLDELRALPEFSDVPTLQQAIDAYGSKINLLIEANIQYQALRSFDLAGALAKIIEKRPPNQEIIVGSFRTVVPTTVRKMIACRTAYSISAQFSVNENYLKYISRAGFDWIVLESVHTTPELIRQAHQLGLRVMLKTAERKSIARLEPELPDAFITDSAEVGSRKSEVGSRESENSISKK